MEQSNSPRPRVLHVVECMGAGVATAVLEYVRNTPEAAHHLIYATRAETSSLPSGWQQQFAGVKPMPNGHRRRIAAVRRQARLVQADVVHAHSSFAGAYARLGMFASTRRRIVYTAHCYAFERLDIPLWKRRGIHAVEAILAMNTSVFAACSLREASLSRYRFSSAEVVVIPNAGAVLLPPADPLAHGDGADHHTVSLAGSGRIGAQKGAEFFRAAVRTLRESGVTVEATWIGGGDTDQAAALRSEGITVTGWLSRSQALATLRAQEVYLHTAAWEGFPLAILEAVHLGVPVIVRSIPAYEGVTFPSTLSHPSQLAAVWADVSTPAGREAVLQECRAALTENTPVIQRRRLSSLYGSGPAQDSFFEPAERQSSATLTGGQQ